MPCSLAPLPAQQAAASCEKLYPVDRAQRDSFLRSVKYRLAATYGDRLRGVLLYGSTARGEAGQDSDVDLLVLLGGGIQLAEDLERINLALYPLQLEMPESIHAYPVSMDDFGAGQYSFLREAKREGIVA